MARKQDEMSLDDELTAAFLSDSDVPALTEEEETVELPEETPIEEAAVEIEEPVEDEEWDDTDELPGQLAVDVYETADKLIIKARTAGIERKDLDVSINDNNNTSRTKLRECSGYCPNHKVKMKSPSRIIGRPNSSKI